jgi:glycerophosphoryl diester phosphodiesterase
MCAFSQSKYPVFFLAGLPTDDSVGDLDRLLRSVMPLLKYSKVHGLILNSAFVVKSPGLLRSGISAGMRVITWGIGNVDEEGVALQITEGVSGFVTDDIKLTKDCILSFVHRPN